MRLNIFILLFFSLILTIFTSCDPYQKVLKSTDLDYKYEKAKEYYNNEDYYKAIPLFEELIGIYKGSKNIEELYFFYAYSQYGEGNYLLAAHHFKNLATTYPYSEYAEESQFMYAYSYYIMSPEYTLDQTFTEKAIKALQLFINSYPDSDRVSRANELIDDLREKLERKALYSAQLYYDLGAYKSAAIAFDRILQEYPDIEERELVQFMILQSYFKLASNSISSRQKERFETTIESYYNFIDKNGSSKFVSDAEEIYEASRKNLEKINNHEQ